MCRPNSQQIVADGQAIGTALDNLAAALEATDPELAGNLKKAGDAIVAATENWKDGDTLTEIQDAEQAAIAVLNVIPATSEFAPLVAIAFTALNLLIANAQTQPNQTGNAMANAHVMLAHEARINTDSPWHGKAEIKHHFLNPPRKDFETAWNEAAAPLGVATITL